MTQTRTTDRLTLRRFTGGDADLLFALNSDPLVMRYLTGGVAMPRAEVEQELLPEILAEYASGRPGRWAAHETATGEFVGWAAVRVVEGRAADDLELGYRLRSSMWGRGYATEAARAVVDEAFRDRTARRVWGQTMAVNVASRRVMEKIGLRYVRTFHLEWEHPIDGAEHGEVEYEALRELP